MSFRIALFALLLTAASPLASASDFSCSDISTLDKILAQLKASCGSAGTGLGFCRANGRIGNTAKEAADNCFKNTSWGQARCEEEVTCQGVGFCRANGRIGANAVEAAANCFKNTSWGEGHCEEEVTCQDVRFCRANGRIGNSAVEAAASCFKNTSWGQARCEEEVTCQ
jgi:hypothetical protein